MRNWIIEAASVLSLREWICVVAIAAMVVAWVWFLNHDGFPPLDP